MIAQGDDCYACGHTERAHDGEDHSCLACECLEFTPDVDIDTEEGGEG